ncbi:DUF5667 domain-containing protein [Stomatohabitans albus]|uniref:DUF5667 domain-containing protein n=1 Tax=Stomatohabitans albus TaxID=3110766 RepID=UPI00300D44F8
MAESFKSQDIDPELADLFVDAFEVHVDMDCASRHLWSIHQEARRVQEERRSANGTDHSSGRNGKADNSKVIEQLLVKASGSEHVADATSDLHEGLGEDDFLFAVDPQPQLHPQCATADYVEEEVEPSAPRGRRRLLTLAGAPMLSVVIMLAMSSTGIAMASQHSRPGDLLYSIKRGTEQARLAMATDKESRSSLQLSFANERLKELRDVGPVNPEVVANLVTEIGASLVETTDATAVERIRLATIDEVKHLEQVAPLPVAVQIPPALVETKRVASAPKPVDTTGPLTGPGVPPTPVAPANPEPAPAETASDYVVPIKFIKPTESPKPAVTEIARVSEPAKPANKPSTKPSAKPSEPVAAQTEVVEVPVLVPDEPTEQTSDEIRNREEVSEVGPSPTVQPQPSTQSSNKPSAKPPVKPIAKPPVKPAPKPLNPAKPDTEDSASAVEKSSSEEAQSHDSDIEDEIE